MAIIKLRKALGDDSRAPSYIETIAKRGYRLMATVRQGEDREAMSAGAARPEIAESTPAGAAPAETAGSIPAEDIRVETVEPATAVLGPASPAPRLPRVRRYVRAAGWMGVVALTIALGGGYLVQSISRPATTPDLAEADGFRQPSWVGVTIVPFEYLGADSEQAYLARGISDNLVTDLSRLSGLRVIRDADATATLKAPGARYRVSGTVQRESGTLRLNVHLIDTTTHEQLWFERFERPFGDLFAVQDELTARLVELLPARVSDVERQRLAKRYTRSLEAYDYFLRGQALFLVRRGDENEAAQALFRKALELDPKFTRAYAGLAMSHAMNYRLRESADPGPALERAFELAETARLIDPDIPEVYWALGFVHAQSRRHAEAIDALQTAITLDRSFADAYALLGGILTYTGQPAKSIPLLRTALRLNPDGGYLYFLLLGRAYLFEDDAEQALINLRAALMRNPADIETRVYLAAALVAAGDRTGARWEADEIRSLDHGFSVRQWLDTYPMTSAPQKERLLTLLAGVEL